MVKLKKKKKVAMSLKHILSLIFFFDPCLVTVRKLGSYQFLPEDKCSDICSVSVYSHLADLRVNMVVARLRTKFYLQIFLKR